MAKRLSGLLELPAPEGARRVALFYLDRASRSLSRLGDDEDGEALHDFRVALRRLRTGLQAYEPYLGPGVTRKLRRRIRDLASSTGGGRDSEVHLAWLESRRGGLGPAELPGLESLTADLERARVAGYARASGDTADRFRKLRRKLQRRLARAGAAAGRNGLFPAVPFAAAVERILPGYASELETCLSRVHSVDDVAEAHRSRIRAKRLRYVLEPITPDVDGAGPLVERLKSLQDLLGELHDAQLLEALVEDRLAALGPESADRAEHPGLERIQTLLAGEQAELFGRLQADWLGGAGQPFFADVEALRRELGAGHPQMVEIERKYLLTGLPPAVEGRSFREIEQGYLPGERLQERIRRIRERGGERYVRTVKVGSGVLRAQLEEETDETLFRALWPLTEGHRLSKRRYRLPADGLVWEIDEFTDRELVLAEVELPAPDMVPEPPEWLGPYVVRDVTDEPEYLNANLAR